MATEITDEDIATAATEAQSATADGQSVTARPLKDLLEAQDRLAAKSLAGSTGSGWSMLRPAKVVPPGAGPD